MSASILLGILGDERVKTSLSPAMHKHALAFCNLTGSYVPIPVHEEELAKTLDQLWRRGFTGLNVTVPYKQLVMPRLEKISAKAQSIGAVNTLTRGERGFIGHNTDMDGCIESLRATNKNHAVAVVGSGGAARAMLAALRHIHNGGIYLLGRNEQKIKDLANSFKVTPVFNLPAGFTAHWFINATPVSSAQEGAELAAWAQTLRPLTGIIDLNYGRVNNFWETLAQKHGLLFQDGLTMLAWQAKHAFALWTSRNVPIDIFQRAL